MARLPVTGGGFTQTRDVLASSSSGGTSFPAINVKDAPYNAKGDGVTDDSAAFQAVADFIKANFGGAGGPEVLVPAGSYVIATTITGTNLTGFKLQGTGSLYSPQMLYSGAGSDGGVFKFSSCAVQLDGIRFGYTNASFTGDVIRFVPGINSPIKITNCHFNTGVGSFLARSMLCLGSNLNTTISDGVFRSAQNGIVFDTGTINNTTQIQRCAFSNCVLREIWVQTPDTESVTIDACTFEGLAGSAIASIDWTSPGTAYSQSTVSNCWFGDDTGLGIPWIMGVAGNGGLAIHGNSFFSNSNRATQPQIQVSLNTTLLMGNYLECSCSPATNKTSTPICSIGNRWNVPAGNQFVTNPASTGGFIGQILLPFTFGDDIPLVSVPMQGPGYGIEVGTGSFGNFGKARWLGSMSTTGSGTIVGPSTGGTFVGSSWAIDPAGRVVVCVAGGAPGSWLTVGARRQPLTDLGNTTGAFTPDMNKGPTLKLTLTGAVTVNGPINGAIGDTLRIMFTQDGTGGRTTTFNAVFTILDFVPVTTAGHTNIIEFECITNPTLNNSWLQVGKVLQP